MHSDRRTGSPTTLGEALAPRKARQKRRLGGVAYGVANAALLTSMSVIALWWLGGHPQADGRAALVLLGLLALWAIGAWIWSPKAKAAGHGAKPHFLLAGDRQGFMAGLPLDAKTVVFDGSNIYHFGLANDLSSLPVRLLAQHLRAEGYRVICYFDANIFYTLIENGALVDGQPHALHVLTDFFQLKPDEVYVVPSGVQADKYVLSTLRHMPVSFAVTNDQFRDYAKLYRSVMKGDQWRKGVYISGNEIKLRQFRFQQPIRLNGMAAP